MDGTLIMKMLLACLFASATIVLAGPVRIAGSDTMVVLNKAWADEFQRANPKSTVMVTGGGSEIGIRALQDRKTDIAASSRPLTAEEKARFKKAFGSELIEIPVGTDVIAIYVHDGNSVPFLTLTQIKDIFTGKIRNWSEVGGRKQPIYVYIRDNDSGTCHFFQDHVLQGEAFWKYARPVASTVQLTEIVSYNSNAIGFGGVAYAKAARRVRVASEAVPLGASANPHDEDAHQYPLKRRLLFYIDPGAVSPDLKKFVQWALSEEGQSIVEGVGYYPLAPRDRAAQLAILGWPELEPTGEASKKDTASELPAVR